MISIINLKSKPTPKYTLYIGRANKRLGLEESKWANPFPMKRERDRPLVVRKHLEYLLLRQDLLVSLHELENQTLACYCHNDEPGHKLCHGDTLRAMTKLVHYYDPPTPNNMFFKIVFSRAYRQAYDNGFCDAFLGQPYANPFKKYQGSWNESHYSYYSGYYAIHGVNI